MNENQTPEHSSSQKVRPTKKQREMLVFIEQFIAEHGYSPSYREIMDGLQYTSVATVALHVNNLITRGHLVKRDHTARSLEVVNPSSAAGTPLLTNEITDAEEKWLVTKVEKLFADVTAEAAPTTQRLDDIALVLAAMRVLGLEGAAQSFTTRLSELRAQAVHK